MIQSMTAFARISGQVGINSVTWELRGVNHRYFDCALKLPESFRQFETEVRTRLQHKLRRGKIDCSLKLSRSEEVSGHIILDQHMIAKLADTVKELEKHLPVADVDPIRILNWPGVLQEVEYDLAKDSDGIFLLFDNCLSEMVVAREREGNELAKLFKERLQKILVIVGSVVHKMPLVIIAQRQKLEKRLAEVVDSLDQNRLEQEMVYFVQRIDVAEELDRLAAHTKEVLRIIDQDDDAGKKLDFLMQELNREANTLASKSSDLEITQAAVELKVLIEQMREQVQNVV